VTSAAGGRKIVGNQRPKEENIMTSANAGSPIEELQKKFNDWREQRKSMREPIPRELWEQAGRLAKTYTIAQISKTLHLEYKKLKDTVTKLFPETAKPLKKAKTKKEQAPTFLNLDFSPSSPKKGSAQRCVITFLGRGGQKVKLAFDELPPAEWLTQVLSHSGSL
jgi:hypothetical protein